MKPLKINIEKLSIKNIEKFYIQINSNNLY